MNKITKLRYMSNQYGNIDLSTLNWEKAGLNFVSTTLPNGKIPASNVAANMICSKYRSVPINKSFVEGDFAINSEGKLYVRDTKYSDIISFKESLKDLILTYELATDNSGGYLPINKIRYMSNQCGNSALTNSIDIYHNDAQKFFYIVGWSGATLYKRVAGNVIPKIGLLDYKAVSNSDLYEGRSGDKTVSLGYPGMYDNFIMVRDLSFNGDTEKFKQFLIGNNVWFELETPTQGGYLPCTKLKYKASDVCQLLNKSKYPNKHTNNGVVFTSNDGVVTANGTASRSRALYYIVNVGNAILGHKYLLAGGVNNSCYIDGYIGATEHFGYDRGSGYIFTANASGKIQVSLNVVKDYTATNVMFKPQLFDLTEMYGAGNEPTTLVEFRQKYPNDLYPYSPQCWY